MTPEQVHEELQTAMREVRNEIRELKAFILEREISAIRWFIGIFGALQVTYFFGTLAMVYFLISHVQKAS
jgi:hypothetical protein